LNVAGRNAANQLFGSSIEMAARSASMTEVAIGTYLATLAILFNRGVRYGTVIDLGCADGHFYLRNFARGLFPGSTCVNVDANALYEPSLREIQEVVGGHYVIAAVSDHDGEIALNAGSHPYWGSLAPPEHAYWAGSINLPGDTLKVRALTLDTLVRELALKPPFLLKLDLQCGELAALRGGEKTLAETDVVICETAMEEFPSVCEFLVTRNLALLDLTQLGRHGDGTLYQLYPVFLNRRLDHVKNKDAFGTSAQRNAVLAQMEIRRDALRKSNASILCQLRANPQQ
jgi:FkbM family methyltransferase